MRKSIVSVGIALCLLGGAGAEELAVNEGQRMFYIQQTSLEGPGAGQSLKADLQSEGLVGTFSQRPVELAPLQPSPQLVNDDFIIRPRPQTLEESLPNLPDRSRPYIMQPNNSLDLFNFSLY